MFLLLLLWLLFAECWRREKLTVRSIESVHHRSADILTHVTDVNYLQEGDRNVKVAFPPETQSQAHFSRSRLLL